MAAGKWISDLPPETALLDAARHALAIRLETVRSQLENLLTRGANDDETVHQLRVATRRAKAALDIFAPCLSKKAGRKIKRCLRKLRRVAGEVRDWDVFLLKLRSLAGRQNRRLRATLDLVNGLALSQREVGQIGLSESAGSRPFAFERLATQTLASLRSAPNDAGAKLGTVAGTVLSERITALQECVASATADLAHFHLIRLAAKHLRYAMEVFGDCFHDEFKQTFYPLVEQMQEALGNLHDSDLAIQRLHAWQSQCVQVLAGEWPRYRPGFEELIKRYEANIAREKRKFRTCWRRWDKAALASELEQLCVNSQRGELVSMAGNDSMTPGVLEGLRSPGAPRSGIEAG